MLHGVGCESIEGNLRPYVFFKTSDQCSVHPEDQRTVFLLTLDQFSDFQLITDTKVQTGVQVSSDSPEDKVMAVDVLPLSGPSEDASVSNHGTAHTPVR